MWQRRHHQHAGRLALHAGVDGTDLLVRSYDRSCCFASTHLVLSYRCAIVVNHDPLRWLLVFRLPSLVSVPACGSLLRPSGLLRIYAGLLKLARSGGSRGSLVQLSVRETKRRCDKADAQAETRPTLTCVEPRNGAPSGVLLLASPAAGVAGMFVLHVHGSCVRVARPLCGWL